VPNLQQPPAIWVSIIKLSKNIDILVDDKNKRIRVGFRSHIAKQDNHTKSLNPFVDKLSDDQVETQ
jgi:hypothetical protein